MPENVSLSRSGSDLGNLSKDMWTETKKSDPSLLSILIFLLFRGCREMTKEAYGAFCLFCCRQLVASFLFSRMGHTNAEKSLYIGLLS